jgi:VWFA-related protein
MTGAIVALIAASAQTTRPSVGQPPVTLRTTTTLVQVNVVAHDSSGRAVGDLKWEEFEVLDSGKPQTLAVFIPERVSASAPPAISTPTQGIFSNQIAAGQAAERAYAVILLDYLNTGFRNTARARQSALDAVNKLAAGTAVGVYTLDRYGLHVRSELGSDRAKVIKAIQSAMGLPGICHQLSLDGLPDDDLADCVTSGTSPLRNFTALQDENRITDTLNSFEAIAGHLKGLPGRKALIWVSAAYPLQLDLRAPAQDLFPEAMGGEKLFTSEVGGAMKALNNADVALYPVDSRALSTVSPVEDSHEYTWPTMDFFAQRTGGKAFYGRNDMDTGMLSAAQDVEVSYTLGYYSPKTGQPEGFHKLTVKSLRPGVTLRYKEGYYAETAAPQKPAERRDSVAKALTGIMDARDIPIEATAVHARNVVRVNLALRPNTLALVKKGDRWKGATEVVMRFAKEDGSAAGTGVSRRIEFNLTQENYNLGSQKGLAFEKMLTVPKDAARLRILVRNDPSGEIGTLTIPLADME